MPLRRKRENKLKNAIVNVEHLVPSGITSRMVNNITGSAGISISQNTPGNEIAGCVVYPNHGVVVVVPGNSSGFSYHVSGCCDMHELSFLEEGN